MKPTKQQAEVLYKLFVESVEEFEKAVYKSENDKLTEAAIRFIQDSQFVQPGETIVLDFFQAQEVFRAGYKLGLRQK